MAYQNYYPATYQPIYGNQNPYLYQQMQQQQMMQQQAQHQQQQNQQIQQSGFVLVQSEQEARAYPVAPGNSITFKDESQPYCYVKTMGFNQLDRPTFERYRLVKEESPETAQISPVPIDGKETGNNADYALKSDLEAIWGEIEAVNKKLKSMQEKKTAKARKEEPVKEENDDE